MLVMNEAWQKWWATLHHEKTPVGSYNPLEDSMYQAWVAGWQAGQAAKGFHGLSGYDVRKIEEETHTKRDAIYMTENMLDEKNP